MARGGIALQYPKDCHATLGHEFATYVALGHNPVAYIQLRVVVGWRHARIPKERE